MLRRIRAISSAWWGAASDSRSRPSGLSSRLRGSAEPLCREGAPLTRVTPVCGLSQPCALAGGAELAFRVRRESHSQTRLHVVVRSSMEAVPSPGTLVGCSPHCFLRRFDRCRFHRRARTQIVSCVLSRNRGCCGWRACSVGQGTGEVSLPALQRFVL